MVVMGCLNTHRNLYGNADRLLDRESRFLLNVFFQCDAFHKLHHDIIDIVILPNIIDVDDVGMHEPCSSLRLTPEFGNKICVFTELLLQNFDSNKAVQFAVFCFIYIRHTTGADLFHYLIPVTYQHSYLNHSFTSSANGSTNITEILSFPPLLLAASINISARFLRLSPLHMI